MLQYNSEAYIKSLHTGSSPHKVQKKKGYGNYMEDFHFVDRFHGSALHDDRCTAGCGTHTNFADESACLTADNVRNEVVRIHRSQGVLNMLSLYTQIFF
jgi:hypothetical protein